MDACITSSLRLWSKMARGTLHIAPKCPAPTAKGNRAKNAWLTFVRLIALILDYRREESLRALPPDAKQELVVIG
jgi:hypothetical protein